ncbi:TRAP transporter large permease [Haloechinothrix sp. YIM 98757]|uniref:TRAP transporter large permease n=1 Tax=Haloechinothrix aidingensis TaxID=2752311 RepID=A0A838ABZ3_9PSEU|nr:TRAP transporter large permease [Haloechinothrix aidingensis]MBA0126782.1 TRAP transporter large permease [Haloechinothrix aidingensis]
MTATSSAQHDERRQSHDVRERNGGSSSAAVRWLVRFSFAGLVCATTATMFADVSPEQIGAAAIVLLIVLLLGKVPVAIALSVPGIVGLYAMHGEGAIENVLSDVPYNTVASWTLSVLPMFVLMGLLLVKSGISTKVYIAARHWLGWLPGGLAIGTTAAGAGLAAVSGTSLGTTYALARIGIPEMLRAGYHRKLAVGSVAIAGLSGQLIPPSILLVVYAGVAQVAVGPQLIAGIGPGVLLAVCFSLAMLLACIVRPRLVEAREGAAAYGTGNATPLWSQRVRSIVSVWPVPMLVAAVLGGMFAGVTTATEAGALGALGALALTFWYQRGCRPWKVVYDAVAETIEVIGAIFFLLIGALIFSRLLAVTGLARAFSEWVTNTDLSRVEFLVVIAIAYFVMGMFLDPLSMLLLTVPLLLPTVGALEISQLWFGVFAVLLAELAVLTPPVGILAFIIHGITRDSRVNEGHVITLGDIFRAIGWLLPVAFVVVLLLIVFPGISTWLPSLMQ